MLVLISKNLCAIVKFNIGAKLFIVCNSRDLRICYSDFSWCENEVCHWYECYGLKAWTVPLTARSDENSSDCLDNDVSRRGCRLTRCLLALLHCVVESLRISTYQCSHVTCFYEIS